MNSLEVARNYVKGGFSVIPLRPKSKKPAISSWKEYQSRRPTEDELVQWFGNDSPYNLGIITGEISGVVGVDLDSEEAIQLAKKNGFPKTPLVKTGRGYHAYFKYRTGVRNFQKRDDLPGIDFRGDGGYVVAPPSIHESGKQYSWVKGRGLDDLPLGDLPDWILAEKPGDRTPLKELYKGVSKGNRNDALARLSGSWVNDGLSFDECMENALLWNSKNKPPLSESEVERTVRSIWEKHQRRLEVNEGSKQPDINSMIEEGIEYQKVLKAISQITLAGEREKHITDLAKRNSITREAVRKDVELYLRGSSTKEARLQEEEKEISGEERKEALGILKSSDFWEKFLDTTELLGYVGEDENKVTLYLGLTSRKLDDPINVIAKGESSAGKSFIVSGVSQFFPAEEVIVLTALTPKALYYRKDSLKHKALIIYERVGAEESDYSLRTLQSEKKLIFSTPVKNPLTGNFETQDIEVEGPIAYIETTTKPHIHPENETRCFDIHIDESEEQTKRIHQAQNRRHEILSLDKESILMPWQNAQRLLASYPVYIPYIQFIKFPTRPIRVRRDRPRFLALIEASALLFQYKRERKIINGREFVVADIEDYTLAYSLICKILESVLKGLSPKIKELIEVAKSFNGKEFTKKDLKKQITWNEKTLDRHINEAVTWGFFDITQEGGRGRAYHYRLVKTDDTPIGLLTPDELTIEIKKQIPTFPRGK